MRNACTLMVLVLYVSAFSQQNTHFGNFRVFPSSVTQTEPVVAVHPANPQILFASAVTINTSNGFKSEGVYVSTDGGTHWFGSDTCRGAYIGNHGGDPGVAIDNGSRLILTHIGSIFPGVYSHTSTDLGLTWSSASAIDSLHQPEDRGSTTIDDNPTSPFSGRVYAAWVAVVQPYPVLVSHSTNGGQSWAPPSAINSPPPARCSGGFIKTGLNGKVYACWAAVTNSFPFAEQFAGFAASTDGGRSWRVAQNIFTMHGINGTLPSKGNIRVNGLPNFDIDKSNGRRRGWIYVVSTEANAFPAGSDPDIILHRSTDDGLTWSGGIRVNQDPINDGKIQYFPALEADPGGGINIIYYDDRNTSSDSAEVMLSRSEDGGESWTERIISSHRFQPKPILGGSSNYQGDHISLTSAGSMLFSFWMDDFSGIYQIWTAPIELLSLGVELKEPAIPRELKLEQNYPNPFNPTTKLGFGISDLGFVTLKVYDVLSREVATLVNEVKDPGTYSIQFDGSNLASGVYFYRLSVVPPERRDLLPTSEVPKGQTGFFSVSRKMILLK